MENAHDGMVWSLHSCLASAWPSSLLRLQRSHKQILGKESSQRRQDEGQVQYGRNGARLRHETETDLSVSGSAAISVTSQPHTSIPGFEGEIFDSSGFLAMTQSKRRNRRAFVSEFSSLLSATWS